MSLIALFPLLHPFFSFVYGPDDGGFFAGILGISGFLGNGIGVMLIVDNLCIFLREYMSFSILVDG